jgi:hypothetical protein
MGTYPVVNVSAILAHPFSLPVQGGLFRISSLLSGRLFVPKDHVEACGSGGLGRYGGSARDHGGSDTEGICRQKEREEKRNDADDGLHDTVLYGTVGTVVTDQR